MVVKRSSRRSRTRRSRTRRSRTRRSRTRRSRTRLNRPNKIQRVRKKKCSRRKKGIKRNNKIQLGGSAGATGVVGAGGAAGTTGVVGVAGAGGVAGGGELWRVGLEVETCITLPEGVENAYQYLRRTEKLTVEEGKVGEMGVKCFRDYFNHHNHLRKYQELILFNTTTDESISCVPVDEKQSVEFIFKEELTISHDGNNFKRKRLVAEQDAGSIVECRVDFVTDLSNMLDGPPGHSQIIECSNTGCAVHVHMSPLTFGGDPDDSFKLNTYEGKMLVLNTILLWCGVAGYEQNYETKFRELGYIRDPSLSSSGLGRSFIYRPLHGKGLDIQDLVKMYNLINSKSEPEEAADAGAEASTEAESDTIDIMTDDMIFVRFVILLITGVDNPFEMAQDIQFALPDKRQFNPKYFNLNCYYFEDIWKKLKGIKPVNIDSAELLEVQRLLDNVARFEFRGAGSILTDCFSGGNSATPENIYDGINKYVSLLNSFCTHAKSLHLSELFPSFLIQVPRLTRSPPPAAPTTPDISALNWTEKMQVLNDYKEAVKIYREQIKIHQTVVLPSELEAFLKYY